MLTFEFLVATLTTTLFGGESRPFSHESSLIGVAASEERSLLVTACQDGLISAWDTESAKLKAQYRHGGTIIYGLTVARSSDVVALSDPVGIWLWRPIEQKRSSLAFSSSPKKTEVRRMPFVSLAISPDGRFLAGIRADFGITIIRITDLSVYCHLPGKTDAVAITAKVLFSDDGKLLFASTPKGFGAIDVDRKATRYAVEIPEGTAASFAYSEKEARLFVGWDKGVILAYEVSKGNQVFRKKLGDLEVECVFARKANTLIVGDASGKVTAFDSKGGTKTFRVNHKSGLLQMVIASESKGLCTIGEESFPLFWDYKTGKER